MNARLARTADALEVVRLVNALLLELGRAPLPEAEAAAAFRAIEGNDGAGFVSVGEVDGSIRAACTVSFADAIRSLGRYAVIQEMYVDPELRSSGLGSLVLNHALQHAGQLGCGFVELGTPADGARQIEFYRRNGFTVVGKRLRWRP